MNLIKMATGVVQVVRLSEIFLLDIGIVIFQNYCY